MKNKSLLLILLTIATLALGFLRDYIFVSINDIIKTGGTYTYLLLLKWVLTLVFSVLYFLLTCAFLFVIFRSRKYLYLVAVVYALLFAVSFFTAVAGTFITSFDATYPFVRAVMGIAQSPIVLMFLIPACFINESILRHQSN